MASKTKKFKHPPLPLNIAMFREARGMTQEEMGEVLGVSQPMIQRIEKGNYNWNQEFLQNCAETLGMSVLDLLPIDKITARRNSEINQLIKLLGTVEEVDIRRFTVILQNLKNLSDEEAKP
jgi:transcriptional regulator with XRE-family HTH domain